VQVSPSQDICRKQNEQAAATSPPERQERRLLHRLAGWLAGSRLLSRGRSLFEANSRDWNLPLSKLGKLQAGGYLILKDYADGRFPPKFEDQAKAYQGEIDYFQSAPGQGAAEFCEGEMRKPFWGPASYAKYSRDFARLLSILDRLGLKPGHRLLELGCCSGWMSEFLAITGYRVVATSIAPVEIELARRRLAACQAKGVKTDLEFLVCPMESVDECEPVRRNGDYDGVFVFEALHHAFDWRRTIRASFRCLKPGGWLLVAGEPNLLHTFISYRVARLAGTHEIGLSQKAMLAVMKECGFKETRVLAPRINNGFSPHWIAARKGS
jgi:2-polyprenyl-3-methyl-5-hydroxy-6-metoxy-1,4-benzoquinol methylase